MQAYHNNSAIKNEYLARVKAHRAADEIVQNYGYWKKGRGCAVGCTIHGSSHSAYETELGIPRILARLEDRIFEGLPKGEAKEWPEKFLSSIRVGADLSGVWPKFAQWLMTDPEHGVLRFASEETAPIIQRVSDLYRDGGSRDDFRADAAAYAYADADADATAAYAAYAAYAAACKNEFSAQAKKLIELLRAA